MPSFNLRQLPFWFHSLIELFPSVAFLLNPARQLDGTYVTPDLVSASCQCHIGTFKANPAAEAIIRQYGVLLFVSVLISTLFAIRKVDVTSRQVASALTVYHLAPVVRATLRLWSGETGWLPKDMGGPWVHLAVHTICFIALGSLAVGASGGRYRMKVPTKLN